MAFDLTIAKLKPLEDKLERIARALEEIVLREYNVPLRATPKPEGGDDSDVLYTDDLSQLRQELEDVVLRHRNPARVIDDEEDLG
jgi:hypothetical protein